MLAGSAPEEGDRAGEGAGGDGGAPKGVSSLVRDLTGDLKCAQCGYNLKGISIRDVCPECGLAVRATILAVVDPRAGELRPVNRPRLVGAGLVAVPAFVLAAVLCLWGVRLSGFVEGLGGPRVPTESLGVVSVWLFVGATVSALALIAPVRGLAGIERLRAFGGVVALAGLTWAHWHVVGFTETSVPVLFGGVSDTLDGERSLWRLVVAAFGVLAILGLRPNALRLAYRSVVLRTGRVDRQPLMALVAAMGVAAAGDVLAVVFDGATGPIRDVMGWIGLVLIAVGSFLLTVGLWGIVVDTWRIRAVIVRPTVGLSDIMADGGGTPARGAGGD